MTLHAFISALKARSNRYILGAGAIYLLMLLFASVRPLERALIGMFNDKVLHVLAYMAISALIYRGLRLEFFTERLLAIFGVVGALGAFDELLQLLSSHRVSDFEDWLYDMLGAVLVLLAILAYRIVSGFYRGDQDAQQK